MNELRGRRRLWDRADLDTSFPTWKKVHPKLKVRLESPLIFAVFCLIFDRLLRKKLFECAFAHP